MLANSNTALVALATKIEADFRGRDSGRAEWVRCTHSLCVHLAEARDLFAADIEFGKWWDASRFADKLNKDERAAAIQMGRDPEQLLALLEATERTSLQHIFTQEFRFLHVKKPAPEPAPAKASATVIPFKTDPAPPPAKASPPPQPPAPPAPPRTNRRGAPVFKGGKLPAAQSRPKIGPAPARAKTKGLPPKPVPKRRQIAIAIANAYGGSWHSAEDYAAKLDLTPEDVRPVLAAMALYEPVIREAKVEERIHAGVPQYRIFRKDITVSISEIVEKIGPLLMRFEAEGKKNAATASPPTVASIAHDLRKLFEEWSNRPGLRVKESGPHPDGQHAKE